MAATGTTLAELEASLVVLADTVASQHIEIKRLTEHINALRKKGESVTDGVPNTGDNNSPNCKHFTAVGRSALHRHNVYFFDPRRKKNRMGWSEKLMKENGIVFNDI